ncbi:MAG: hypothetical protein ABIP20_19460 [Chthoniobacteraceae bacterium]
MTPKAYFIRREASEYGPYSVPQLNQMRSRKEIGAADLFRPDDSPEYRPLAEVFPHMADFVQKTAAEREKEKWKIEGGSLASAGWAAGIFAAVELLEHPRISWAFAIVGVAASAQAWRFHRRIQAIIGFVVCVAVIVAVLSK